MLLSLFKVEGHSMEPTLRYGSFVLASSVTYILKEPKVGDIVLFENGNKTIIKEIRKILNDKYFVEGENKKDSKNFAPIKKKDILGKIIFNF